MRKFEKHGILGWVATALIVTAYDYWALHFKKQTMSAAFKNGAYRRTTSVPVLLGWAILTWHLIHPRRMRKTDIMSILLDRKAFE